jgi:outer membrane autotransporter protein
LRYNFGLTQAGGTLTARFDSIYAAPRAKALSEGWLAGLSFLRQGADLVEGQGIFHARLAAAEKCTGPAVFAAVQGSHLRNNSGSHVDVDGFSMLTGLAWNAGYLTLGAFFEAGWGNYDSYNSFDSFASAHGEGNTKYYGSGILGRLDLPSGFYAEASARVGRVGRVDTDFNSGDLRHLITGAAANYDAGSAYYGAHAGIGYTWQATSKLNLDLFTKYLWTRQSSDDVMVWTDPVHFAAANSHRWRTGARLSYAATPCLSPYIGAAYEYEFDGKVRASTAGYAIDAPSLKGSTGVGELGFTLKPSPTLPLSFDLGVQGYTGKREGVTGSLQVKFEF